MFVKELAKKLSKKRNEELYVTMQPFWVSEAKGRHGIRRTPKQFRRTFD